MHSPSATKSGLLIIRAWVERDVPGFRARVIQMFEATGREQDIATVGNVQDLADAIAVWVQGFQEGAGVSRDPGE
jgi:hypothetical protein